MKLTIYQIQSDYDQNRVMYQGYDSVMRSHYNEYFPSEIYEKVYEGQHDFQDIEEIYKTFNGPLPDGYRGRSLSVSDVITIDEPCGKYQAGAYFCDHIGWQSISDFHANEVQPSRVSCIYVQPGMEAQSAVVSPSLSRLQELCYGNIECVHFFEEDDVLLICNEDGKFQNLPPCRAFYDQGEIFDVVAGPFLIMQEGEDGNFRDMDPDTLEKYLTLYKSPEYIHVENGEIVVDKLSRHHEQGKDGPEL